MTSNTKMVIISRAEYEKYQAQEDHIVALTGKMDYLMELIRLSSQKRFGASSEQSTDDGMEQLSFLFNEAEVYVAEEMTVTETPVPAHTRKKKSGSAKDILPENCPVDVVEHRLSAEELSCQTCGTEMVEIGKEVHYSIKIIPAQVRLQEDHYFSYACKFCEKETGETPVVQTPREKTIIPGGFASPEAVAHIMTQKFVMGSPLYRQEQELKRQGVQLSRQTMSNWILRCSKDWLTPVYEEGKLQ